MLSPNLCNRVAACGLLVFLLLTSTALAVAPYVVTVFPTHPGELRIVYSEAVNASAALDPASYTLTIVGGGGCPPVWLGPPSMIAGHIFAFATSPQVAGCPYRLDVVGAVSDADEGLQLVAPTFGTFRGNERLRTVSATSGAPNQILVAFSKPVSPTGAANASYFRIPASLGPIVSSVRHDLVDPGRLDADREVLITHAVDQSTGLYPVVVDAALTIDGGSETLTPDLGDRTAFVGFGGFPVAFGDGPLACDPFADGAPSAFVFVHGGRIYLGPNSANSGLLRFEPDGSNAIASGFATSSATGAAPSFGASFTRPSTRVTAAGTPAGTRFELPVPTDLRPFGATSVGNVTGCMNVANNRIGYLSALSDGLDFVVIGTGGVSSTAETCQVEIYNDAGPQGVDRAAAFVPAVVDGSSYLLYGCLQLSGGSTSYKEIYFTQDLDATLDNAYCDIGGVTFNSTRALQSIYGHGSYVYLGFSSDTSRWPLFAVHRLTAAGGGCDALSDRVTNIGGQTISTLPFLGSLGASPNTAPRAGIDSMIVFDPGSGNRLYVANNGGIASTGDLPPIAGSSWSVLRRDGDGVFFGTTQRIPSIGPLRPGEKGIPFMVPWGGSLLVARNRSDNNRAELWKHNAAGWAKILDSASPFLNPNGTRISLLAVSGGRLYIGFDNPVNGAEVYRTRHGVTASSLSSSADLEKRGVSGLGPANAPDLLKNAYIFDHASTTFGGQDRLYLTVGCAVNFNDNGPCDRDPSGGVTDFGVRVFHEAIIYPGGVPDGSGVPGTPLRVARGAGGQIDLVWGNSCVSTDADYEIYQGALGSYFSHGAVLCSTSGETAATLPPGSGNSYYLVVPKSPSFLEGSYGVKSDGTERPRGIPSCNPQELITCP